MSTYNMLNWEKSTENVTSDASHVFRDPYVPESVEHHAPPWWIGRRLTIQNQMGALTSKPLFTAS